MKRKALLWGLSLVITVLLCALLVEVGLRVVISTRVGPSVLLYGTSLCCGPKAMMAFDPKEARIRLRDESHTVNAQRNQQGDYSKYFPFENLVEFDKDGTRFPVRTNSGGFRGKETEADKPPGVIRVVMLGASSTFGYHDRDNETYPFYTEEMLNARISGGQCGNVSAFEVVNLGIPHLTSQMIRALFRAEGVPLHPDFVTFYEGINDTQLDIERLGTRNDWDNVPLYYKVIRKLRKWVLTFALVDNLMTVYGERYTPTDLQRHLEGKLPRFLGNLEAIEQEAKMAGAEFFVASQQAKAMLSAPQEGLRGVTYAAEVDSVRATVNKRGWLSRGDLNLLTHAVLMEGLRDWSRQRAVPLVDAMHALDSRRDLLLSGVHLAPEGNRIIARAFADTIFHHACSPDTVASRNSRQH